MQISVEELKTAVTELLNEKKANDIVALSLQHAPTIADYMIVASANSTRQLYALADHVADYLKKHNISSTIDGKLPSEWVVVAGGGLLIHLFKPETRAYYDLETMWQDSPAPAN